MFLRQDSSPIGWTIWPASHRDAPVSAAYSALGSLACSLMACFSFFGDWNWIFLWVCHELYPLGHLASLLTGLWINSPLMHSSGEHLICFLAICISLEKCLFNFFTIFQWVDILLSHTSSLYMMDTWISIYYQIQHLQIFSPIQQGFSFHSVDDLDLQIF